MAEENAVPEPEETPEEALLPRGPLIPPIVVRIAIMGGILAALAIGALFLVTDVIAPRIQALGRPAGEEEVAAAAAGGAGERGEAGAAVSAGSESEKGSHGGKAAKGGKGKKHEHGELVSVSDLIVNPAGTGGRRFLKVAASIELTDAKLAAELEGRQAPLRDLLIRELSARTLEELTDPTAKEEMRQSILEELEAMMGPDVVKGLYFTEYVVQ